MNLRDIKQRILSVKGTQKITQAMKLVASAKLRRAQHAIEGMRPYQHKLDSMLSSFIRGNGSLSCRYTEQREAKKVAVIAVASDTSLCGAFNSNVIRLLKETLDEYKAKGAVVELFTVGQKMSDAAKKLGMPVNVSLMEQSKRPVYADVAKVAYSLMESFGKGETDRVEIIYTHFASAARSVPVRELFLPFEAGSSTAEEYSSLHGCIVEPGRDELLQALLPKVIALRLYTALLSSVASEHASRMIAMQAATENANDLISELTLEYNKGRQQAITNELLDIVSGQHN